MFSEPNALPGLKSAMDVLAASNTDQTSGKRTGTSNLLHPRQVHPTCPAATRPTHRVSSHQLQAGSKRR